MLESPGTYCTVRPPTPTRMREASPLATLGAVLCFCASSANAVGFGRVSNTTQLGQPLNFSAVIRLEPDESLTRECVSAEVQSGENMLQPGLVRATLEGSVYGSEGRQRNASLLDYKLLTTADAPEIEVVFVEHPASNGGPRGSKGVGEPPIVPTAAAVANAIASATGHRVRRLPMTPERVWRAVTTGDDGAAERNAPFGPRPDLVEVR